MINLNPVKTDPVLLVEACIRELCKRSSSDEAKPMTRLAIECLRLEGQKLPPSLARYLAFDGRFYAMSSNWGEFDNTAPIGSETPNEWESVSVAEEVERLIESLAWRPVDQLVLTQGKQEPVARPIDYLKLKLKGSLFRLPNIGDQGHFLYVGKPDNLGEYPVLCFQMKGDLELADEYDKSKKNVFWGQLDVFVKYPNFAVYLYDQIFDADIYPDDFGPEIETIYANNPELRS